jgi:Tfp pilus assembly protein PilF
MAHWNAHLGGPGPKSALLFVALAAACLMPAGCTSMSEDRARLFNDDGVQLYAQGDFAGALDCFDLALTLRPQDETLLFNVGQCYERLGDAAAAEKFYGACLLKSPRHADARMALVEILYRTGKKPQADRIIDEWLQESPNSADAFVLDAWRLLRAKAYPEAQGRLQQALDIDPHNRRALAELAVLYEQTGMASRAYVLYERILERDPSQAHIAQKLDQLRLMGVGRPLQD